MPEAVQSLVLSDIESLRVWRRQLLAARSLASTPLVRFDLTGLSSSSNETMTRRARAYRSACGCGTAASFVSASVALLVVVHFATGGTLSGITWMDGATALASVTIAALGGKMLGLLWARWKIVSLSTTLLNRLQQELRLGAVGAQQ